MHKYKVGDEVKIKSLVSKVSKFKDGETVLIESLCLPYMGVTDKNPVYSVTDLQGVGIPGGIYEDEIVHLVRSNVTAASDSKTRKTTLPVDSNARKEVPMLRGCVRYFPAALAGVANTSKLGNDKHNPGEEMHHARSKSTDQGDCVVRHLMDTEDLMAAYARGDKSVTPEMILIEVNQLAWRALAYSQEIHEKFGAPLAPGAKLTGGK